jgi:hypothetical protein
MMPEGLTQSNIANTENFPRATSPAFFQERGLQPRTPALPPSYLASSVLHHANP